MFCPRCGQERVSQETSFCSQCGFLLTGAAELLERGGVLDPTLDSRLSTPDSPRARGVKFGIFMMLLTLVIAPILGLFTVFLFRLPPWPMGVAIFLLAGGGLLRIVHALMFESTQPGAPTLREKRWARWHSESGSKLLMPPMAPFMPMDAWTRGGAAETAKPDPRLSTPASPLPTSGTGRWLDTSDLEPGSVTETTTRQLKKDPRKPGS